jgi:alpha-N-arabinofuranosidase
MNDNPRTDASPRILHVAVSGDDNRDGSGNAPLRHINAAARLARPGDTVRVHAGLYRESIHPARGGLSDAERITYEAADGEDVEIRGSQVVTGWEEVKPGVWKAEIPNERFAGHNPFAERIRGDWFIGMGRSHHTACVFVDGVELLEAVSVEDLQPRFWTAEVNEESTGVWIHHPAADPNELLVEVNVRPTLFYPETTGIDYITVRGFTMRHAATNWAPPTAEQIGLIGTNWSKGWIIENCTITHSRCVGITLGKYGDEHDNTSANSAEGYVGTIRRALERGWNRDTVGSHIVRNNTIAHCEQAGIVGSLGAIFSEVTGNTIHDIHVHRLFDGAEQAAVKFHAPIDSLIADNHIFRSIRGVWLDWMTQGTRITRNLCHENYLDLFVEVNHGPFVVDQNVFLSPLSILTMSQGGAFLNNLVGGRISRIPELGRETPWHAEHSTEIAGITHIRGGDDRFLNNLMLRPSALHMAKGAIDWVRGGEKAGHTCDPCIAKDNRLLDRAPELEEREDGVYLILSDDGADWESVPVVGSDDLGKTKVSGLPFKDFTGEALELEKDFFDRSRSDDGESVPGPFARSSLSDTAIKLMSKPSDSRRS